MIPNLVKLGYQIKCIASSNGISSTYLAKKYNLSYSTTDYKNLIKDNEINTILITTRHDTHAQFAKEVLKVNKNLYVEKPLALNYKELNEVIKVNQTSKSSSLLVGFNRRFSIHARSVKKYMNNNSPINIAATMNAGYIPGHNWVNKSLIGGGRIIGEVCHLIDLCIYLTDSEVSKVCMNSINNESSEGINDGSILLKFKNGSNAAINYFTNGSSLYPKERVEIYDNNKTFIIKNFNMTEAYGVDNFKNIKNLNDKGHEYLFSCYLKSINDGSGNIIPISQIYNCSKTTIAATQSLMEKRWVDV